MSNLVTHLIWALIIASFITGNILGKEGLINIGVFGVWFYNGILTLTPLVILRDDFELPPTGMTLRKLWSRAMLIIIVLSLIYYGWIFTAAYTALLSFFVQVLVIGKREGVKV